MEDLKRIAKWFESKQKIVAITGAGMSTESGIPDFRSSAGLYNEKTAQGVLIEDVLSISFFSQYPEGFYRIYYEKLLFPEAHPNSGHLFLKKLEDEGHEVTIVTQNIDGLHQKAGSTQVLELHGNANKVMTKTGRQFPLDKATWDKSGLSVSGEWARPAITLYGEMLDRDILEKSIQAISEADILLVMGTSLNVYPAAGLIYDYHGDKSILVNREGTPLNTAFSFVYKDTIGNWVEKVRAHLNYL